MNHYSYVYEYIPDRLYYATLSKPPKDDMETHYFSTDASLVYLPFEADFGPLNLGQTYAFFAQLSYKLKDKSLRSKRIVYYSAPNYNYRANAVTLISLFMVVVLNYDVNQVAQIVAYIRPYLTPYRDACMGPCTYAMTVYDCLAAARRAVDRYLFNLNTFKYDDYYFYSYVENGDLTWVVPDKIIAFAGPVSQGHTFFKYHPFTPASYIPLFQARGVSAVVRLNEACYNKADFVKAGIHHYDLPYPDGGLPPERVVRQFMQIMDSEAGAVAVHCKAGLGRTGTLIGLYMMRKWGFSGREIIAWLRLLRPGMVLGQYYQYLLYMESTMRYQGGMVRRTEYVESPARITYRQTVVGDGSAAPQGTLYTLARTSPRPGSQLQQTTGSPTPASRRPPSYTSRNQPGRYGNQSPSQYRLAAAGPLGRPFYSPYRQAASGLGERPYVGSPSYLNNKVNAFNNTMSPSRTHYYQYQSPYAYNRVRSSFAASPSQREPTLAYGFGANGRVHPDVVRSPVSYLNNHVGRGLPGIQRPARGRGFVSDNVQ